MKTTNIIWGILTALSFFSCTRPKIDGMYQGTFTFNDSITGSGSAQVSLVSQQVINISLELDTLGTFNFNNCTVSGNKEPLSVSMTNSVNTLNGTIGENFIDINGEYLPNSLSFNGNK